MAITPRGPQFVKGISMLVMRYDRVTNKPPAPGKWVGQVTRQFPEAQAGIREAIRILRMGGSQQGKMFTGPGSAGERPGPQGSRDWTGESWVCSELRQFLRALEAFMSLVETIRGNSGQGLPAIPFGPKPAPGME